MTRECRGCSGVFAEGDMVDCDERGWWCEPCDEDHEPVRVPCGWGCGNLTTIDPVYGDLCYRCCRAENE